MKHFIFTFFLILLSCTCIGNAYADTSVEELCLKKDEDLTCQMLNYDLTYAGRDEYKRDHPYAVCSPCPLDTSRWSCATRGASSNYTSITVVTEGAIPVCTSLLAFSCDKMGYRIAKSDVNKIRYTFSCSACPLDGNIWACAGEGPGLVK